MGGAMLSKSLIQYSVAGQGCVPSLLFDLRPNYGGGNEDNGDLLQKAPGNTAALRPRTLQQATTDPALTHPGHLKIPHTVQTPEPQTGSTRSQPLKSATEWRGRGVRSQQGKQPSPLLLRPSLDQIH